MVKGTKTQKYDKSDLDCELTNIAHVGEYTDWDDTMKTLRMVRPSEHKKIMRDREKAEIERKEQAEIAA